jgi:hypothetical protein
LIAALEALPDEQKDFQAVAYCDDGTWYPVAPSVGILTAGGRAESSARTHEAPPRPRWVLVAHPAHEHDSLWQAMHAATEIADGCRVPVNVCGVLDTVQPAPLPEPAAAPPPPPPPDEVA